MCVHVCVCMWLHVYNQTHVCVYEIVVITSLFIFIPPSLPPSLPTPNNIDYPFHTEKTEPGKMDDEEAVYYPGTEISGYMPHRGDFAIVRCYILDHLLL